MMSVSDVDIDKLSIPELDHEAITNDLNDFLMSDEDIDLTIPTMEEIDNFEP